LQSVSEINECNPLEGDVLRACDGGAAFGLDGFNAAGGQTEQDRDAVLRRGNASYVPLDLVSIERRAQLGLDVDAPRRLIDVRVRDALRPAHLLIKLNTNRDLSVFAKCVQDGLKFRGRDLVEVMQNQ
jgi:hypothetical protein